VRDSATGHLVLLSDGQKEVSRRTLHLTQQLKNERNNGTYWHREEELLEEGDAPANCKAMEGKL
jgi:hypothetical protein